MADSAAAPTATPPSEAILLPTASAAPLDAARQRPQAPSSAMATVAPSSMSGAVPLSMPAILQNPKNKHLLGALGKKERSAGGDGGAKKGTSAGAAPGGKRRRRRWENAQLSGNPHLHRPTRADFAPGPSLRDLSTTFAPPPATFSRSTYISSSPSSVPSPALLASASTYGQFSMSLRGLRRNIRGVLGPRAKRGEGGRTEEVLEIMERELVAWLTLSGRVPDGFYHDDAGVTTMLSNVRGKALDPTPLEDFHLPLALPTLPDLPSASSITSAPALPATLTELTRLPHTLVWLAPSPHHRFLLHSLARYYNLQSFSRPLSPLDPDVRVTHVLRPQLTRPLASAGGRTLASLETPPGTDWSSAGGGTTTEGEEFTAGEETETDAASEAGELAEDWERVSVASSVPPPVAAGAATDDEAEAVYSSSTESEEVDSIYGGDHEGEDAAPGGGVDSLASSFADLSTSATPRPAEPAGAATPSKPFLPFLPSPFSGSTTPTPISARLASTLADDDAATPTRARDRLRGRRSLGEAAGAARNGTHSVESSPSRSPTRALNSMLGRSAGAGRVSFGAAAGGGAAEWRLPETGFVDWLFDE
ncbi:hypothetical protein JCM5296_003065 [Sporobolomyces johnsonii]